MLPELRGWNPLVTALKLGLTETGVTLFRADARPDCGPIINQQVVRLESPMTIANAIEHVQHAIKMILIDLMERVSGEGYELMPQDERNATYSLWRDDLDYFIDWQQDAASVERHVMASGSPYGGARSVTMGHTVAVNQVRVVSEDWKIANRTVGKAVDLDDQGPLVICGKGMLRLVDMEIPSCGPNLRLRHRFDSPQLYATCKSCR